MDIKLLASEIRSFLADFEPEDPVEALAYLEVLSAIKEEKTEKRLKSQAYAQLENASPEGRYEHNGIVIVRVKQTKTVWNRTGEVIVAEAELKAAKAKLEEVQKLAGFTTQPGNEYWQIQKEETVSGE
jgi:hypothetical protein